MANKISIMLISGKREQLQMASMVASVGAVSGNDVTVFLSMNALEYFKKDHDGKAPSDGPMGDLLAEKNAPEFMELFVISRLPLKLLFLKYMLSKPKF